MKKFWKTFLFFAVAVTALALIITCATAISYAVEKNTVTEIIAAVITLLAGGYAVYKASRATMEQLDK